jgi:hypothetical protein
MRVECGKIEENARKQEIIEIRHKRGQDFWRIIRSGVSLEGVTAKQPLYQYHIAYRPLCEAYLIHTTFL